jgi:hypothetical protein
MVLLMLASQRDSARTGARYGHAGGARLTFATPPGAVREGRPQRAALRAAAPCRRRTGRSWRRPTEFASHGALCGAADSQPCARPARRCARSRTAQRQRDTPRQRSRDARSRSRAVGRAVAPELERSGRFNARRSLASPRGAVGARVASPHG